MDQGGTIKVRRRFTGTLRTANGTITLRASQYLDFRRWFEVNCAAGAFPTWFKRPLDGAEECWRITAPPSYSWVDKVAVAVSLELEQLPEWATLTP